ncbi:MAG: N-acetyl-gamma-glutamyl-phosphate reductase [Planctomycetota bacterium]
MNPIGPMGPIGVVIVGAGGYAGAELASILLAHPHAKLLGLFASARREKGDQPGLFADLFPRFRGRCDLPVLPASVDAIAALKPDAVFLATPHEASLDLAPHLLARSIKVFDLSAAFRLKDASLYPKHYAFEHTSPSNLSAAVYGLPERFRSAIKTADLIAVPGCYPTSAILPLAPLVAAGAVRPGSRIIVDSVSGASGLGRGLSQRGLLCELSLQAYGVMSHRHEPEIAAYSGTPVTFTPHLVAFDRGILSTIHVELATGWTAQRVTATLQAAYIGEPFVRLLPPKVWPAVADIRNTNCCDIGWQVSDDNHLIISSALDNLVKGAAGQAVQCFNLRFALEESMGLV